MKLSLILILAAVTLAVASAAVTHDESVSSSTSSSQEVTLGRRGRGSRGGKSSSSSAAAGKGSKSGSKGSKSGSKGSKSKSGSGCTKVDVCKVVYKTRGHGKSKSKSRRHGPPKRTAIAEKVVKVCEKQVPKFLRRNQGSHLVVPGSALNICDIDECAQGTHTCNPQATCTNTYTPGFLPSFTCQCNQGYTGDGFACTDIDECATGADNCNDQATCTNTPGSFTCACNTGYSGDGVTCVDIDECAAGTHTCAANAACTNTPGSFFCTCNPGYQGDGSTCTDIDECAQGTHNCGPNEECVNTVGSFTCEEIQTCDTSIYPYPAPISNSATRTTFVSGGSTSFLQSQAKCESEPTGRILKLSDITRYGTGNGPNNQICDYLRSTGITSLSSTFLFLDSDGACQPGFQYRVFISTLSPTVCGIISRGCADESQVSGGRRSSIIDACACDNPTGQCQSTGAIDSFTSAENGRTYHAYASATTLPTPHAEAANFVDKACVALNSRILGDGGIVDVSLTQTDLPGDTNFWLYGILGGSPTGGPPVYTPSGFIASFTLSASVLIPYQSGAPAGDWNSFVNPNPPPMTIYVCQCAEVSNPNDGPCSARTGADACDPVSETCNDLYPSGSQCVPVVNPLQKQKYVSPVYSTSQSDAVVAKKTEEKSNSGFGAGPVAGIAAAVGCIAAIVGVVIGTVIQKKKRSNKYDSDAVASSSSEAI